MPLPFAFPVGFVIGLTLAWLARVELARSEVPLVLARPFFVAAAFGGLVFAPVVAYFVALHGDWAYLYLVRSSRVPSAVDLALVVAAAGCIPLGLALGAPWAMARRATALSALGGALGLVVLTAAVVLGRRLSVSASHAQFHAGFGVMPAPATSLGRAILLAWLALLAGYGWSARMLHPGASKRGT